MSTTEEKLHKLKVTDLKELLAKHHLVQTGKKDDLIKRLLDNKVSIDDAETEELEDPPTETPVANDATSTDASAKPISNSAQPLPTADGAAATTTLTPEQQALKARAERFGITFNPNPTPSSRTATKPGSGSATPTAHAGKTPSAAEAGSSKATPAAGGSEAKPGAAAPKEKAGAIDKAPVGVSDETLAKRAARFGLPEKKEKEEVKPVSAVGETKKEAAKPAEPELSPEAAARRAEDEEKKRKRAEKFGTAKPATNGIEEPDAKKAKV